MTLVWVRNDGDVLAACDKEIADNPPAGMAMSFYKGELVAVQELKKMLKTASNVNLLGEKAVLAGKETSLVNKAGELNGIPYAIFIRL
ncbi:hypothetical protein HY546_01820 [archaeon]|nr:hypothetical protein [archaeon]